MSFSKKISHQNFTVYNFAKKRFEKQFDYITLYSTDIIEISVYYVKNSGMTFIFGINRNYKITNCILTIMDV